MQKKLIALALASLAGSAFAQSNVTIYGVADVTYDFVGATGATVGGTNIKKDSRLSANSSYLGFKGAEDLGNGLKAVFQFETTVTNDAPNDARYNNVNSSAGASNTLFGGMRDTFVGLSSGFGTVVAGNLTAAARALGAKVDVNSGATGVGYQAALYGRIGATKTGVDDRTGNAIAYVSPNYAGFSGIAAWGLGNENKQDNAAAAAGTVGNNSSTITFAPAATVQNVYSLGLNYENGPIYVGYAYTQVDSTSGLANTPVKAQSNRVGGYFKFATAQIGALWDRTDANINAGGAAGPARNVWLVNGKVGVGAGNIIAGYGQAQEVGGIADSGAKHYFVGYEHSLSKRTILKAEYAEVKNKAGVAYNFYNDSTGTVNGLSAGSDPRALSLGVRHSF